MEKRALVWWNKIFTENPIGLDESRDAYANRLIATYPDVNDFISCNFDLLINYYDVEKAILLNITNNSNAVFKVGFSSIDKRLNHLMINTNAENYSIFVNELFRYLKILNKI